MKKCCDDRDDTPSLSRKKVSVWECEAKTGGVDILCSATEWANGEGFDLSVGDKPPLPIHLDEFDVLKILFDKLNADFHTPFKEET